ncbi:lysylphosphatidylglycerol synthase transmembrane domain-containing protein [Anaeromicropila herbilytica]|nr:lysylphosphatidylglycerol synthase transmembrane domain-containing protein [Anaeromicropila herbilytica]
MMNKRNSILNVIFLVIVFAITLYYIFHGQDMHTLLNYIKNTDVRYWFLAVICVILFIGCESLIIYYMMHTIQQKISLLHCFLYSFVGFFFCNITPSATGGPPAQLYYMKKDKVPLPIATLVLMIVTITYKLVLVAIGLIVIIIRPFGIMHYLSPVLGICYLGLSLNIICVVFMVLLVFHPTMTRNLLLGIVKILKSLHVMKQTDYLTKKIEHALKQYQDVAMYFRTHKLVVMNVFIITIFQRLLLFYVTYLTYLSFGLHGTGIITIITLQAMISVAVEMLPLPGGMGISEKLFLMIFTPLFGNLTLPAMVVSRGLSYYTELIISALFTIVSHFVIKEKIERVK